MLPHRMPNVFALYFMVLQMMKAYLTSSLPIPYTSQWCMPIQSNQYIELILLIRLK